jgi:glycerol-3-phosphate dehydrogenase subunit C
LKQLEVDTNISNDEALHPIELMAKSYKLWLCQETKEKF